MRQVAAIVGLLVLTCAGWVLLGAFVSDRWPSWLRWPRRQRLVPTSPPVERIAADLHRLTLDFERIYASDLPKKAARLRATTLAYDDVLLTACRALEVPPPVEHPPMCPVDRLQAEAELARAGLSW